MGALRKLKSKMMSDPKFSRTPLRSTQNEILIDLDGDKEADIALLAAAESGDIDFAAVDLTGSGEFDLYIGDTDENGTPNMILYDENGNVVRHGGEPDHGMIAAASLVRSAVITGDYISDTLEEKLDELDKQLKRAQEEFKSRKRGV